MRYRFYPETEEEARKARKVICVTTFAKKPIRGVATCAEGDTFSYEIGKAIALQKCKVAYYNKRNKYAKERYLKAFNAFIDARSEYQRALAYTDDTLNDYVTELNNYEKLRQNLK